MAVLARAGGATRREDVREVTPLTSAQKSLVFWERQRGLVRIIDPVGSEAQQQQQTGTTAGPAPVVASPKQSAGTRIVEGMLANGQKRPEVLAEVMREHPEARTEILTLLHNSLGNAFVQQVVAAESAGPDDKPKAKKGHVVVESEGEWEELKQHGKSGFSKYGGGKVKDKLVELTNAGQLKLTGTQIAVFDAVSQVETGGQIGCVQTYDDQVVSVGFKQVVLGHGSLEKMMKRAPVGFAKHGLALDPSKTYKKAGWSKQPHQIVGCPDVEALRTPDWAIKFYHASMEPDVIAAMCELLAQEQGIVDAAIDREGGVNESHFDDATAKSWLLEVYNNRPAFTAKAIEAAGKKKAAGRDEFLDTLSDAIIDTYVIEEPKLHFNKAKKAAEKKGQKLTPEQETQLLADMKKKYEPIGRKKGTNIVTKIGRKVTPAKLASTSTASAAPATSTAPATTPVAAPAAPALPVAIPSDHDVDANEADDGTTSDVAATHASDTAVAAPAPAPTPAPVPTPTPAPVSASEPTKEPAHTDSRTTPVVEAAAPHAPQPFRVTTKGLNVRSGAGTGHDIIGGLKRGDSIDVIGREGKWLMITYEGQPAFVHGQYAEPAEAKAASSDTPQPKPRVATDAAGQATKPPKQTAPSQRADETPWWYDDETAASANTAGSATADAGVAIAKGTLDVIEDVLDPFGWFGDDETKQPAQPSAPAAKPSAPTAKPTPAPAAKPGKTEAPVGALTPADLHNETLERMVATMNNPQVTAIAGELAGLQAKSRELKKKADRREEQGGGRDALVEGIRIVRGKLDGLGSAQLDKQQVKAFKAAVYHALQDIAPYYFQSRNIDILEPPPANKTRTCNMTCLGMALESIGKNPDNFTGDREAVMAAARIYQHKIVGDDVSDPAQDAVGGRGTTWTNLVGMRFPDFLELAAIAHEMKGGDYSEAGVKAGAKLAYDTILDWGNIVTLAGLFKTTATQKLFNASGTKDTTRDKKVKKADRVKHDYKLLKAHGDKNRKHVEAFINQQNQAERSGRQKDQDKLEELRPAYEAAIADDGAESGLAARADLDGYRDHIVKEVGADLDAGSAVIVGLSGHFVRLQSLDENHVLVNDPARDSRALTKLSYAEARAMGYFATRFVIR